MNIRQYRISDLLVALSAALALVGAAAIVQAQDAGADHKGMHGAMQHHGAQQGGTHGGAHGKGHDGGGGRSAHGEGHGKGHGGHGGKGHGGGHHLFGKHWKTTLSAEQKSQLDSLHLEFAKTKHVLKSRIEALKVELAVLSVADQPHQDAVDKQIDELLAAKREMMQAKFAYIGAQRAVLTPEQRVSFDMEVIHKASGGGKKGKGGHGGGGH